VTAGLARGGVQIEPNVSIEDEYALHGVLGLDGSLEIGELVRQRCDARGAWLATERIDRTAEPLVAVREPIFDELRRVAGALFAAGYHGPFGIDAYSYRGGLQTRSEINARYSMGFAIGFGPPP